MSNTIVPRSLESRYKPLPSHIQLKEVFCLKEYRCVKRDHTLSWGGQTFQLQSPIKYSIRGQKIEIRTYLDLTWKAFFAGKPIELTPWPAPFHSTPINQSPMNLQPPEVTDSLKSIGDRVPGK